jgi:hypothetical protein
VSPTEEQPTNTGPRSGSREDLCRPGDVQLECSARRLDRSSASSIEPRSTGHWGDSPRRSDCRRERRVVGEEQRVCPPVLRLRRGQPRRALRAVTSASTTSLGPEWVITRRDQRLAAVTYALPRPTTASTGAIVSVPLASAATACAPTA